MTLYRYVLYLSEDDWGHLRAGFERRVRRFRSKAKLDQIDQVRDSLIMAAAERIPDGDECRYAIHLSEGDFSFLWESAMHHKYGGVPKKCESRMLGEFFKADADAVEV